MKLFYDVLFTTDHEFQLTQLEFGNSNMKETYHLLFKNWVDTRRHITSVFPITSSDTKGDFIWDEDQFYFKRLDASNGQYHYLLLHQDYMEDLFRNALDLINDGVQLYDQNGYALFFNRASRKISQIPPTLDVNGRHLLDLFAIDEDVSTTLTALKNRAPVVNRVDHFRTTEGVLVSSANTSHPIKHGNQIIGAVTFEQTPEIVKAYKEKMQRIEKALQSFQSDSPATRFSGYTFEHVIGHGEALQRAIAIARKIAPQESSVLLVGETGTGKEVFAQSIHRCSSRKSKKFVALNCAAIPDSLIESLLFGTQKGSFTGSENRPGYFEEAEGGTLFLDEMNSMSLVMQSKILRSLQERSFRRVGGQKDITMNVRIISSCNKDPFQCIKDNELRKDLFYRLSTVMIELPPLRKHKEDLEELTNYHLSSTAFQYVHGLSEVSSQVMDIFRSYDWPGNVRELFHVLDYAQNVVDGPLILPEHLPSYLLKQPRKEESASKNILDSSIDFQNTSLQNLMDDYEHKVILQALEHFGYNITRTAEALGLKRQSLQYRIHKYGIIV